MSSNSNSNVADSASSSSSSSSSSRRGGKYSQFFDNADNNNDDSNNNNNNSATPQRLPNEPNKESRLDQQSLGAWYPVRSSRCVVISLLVLSIFFLAAGITLLVVASTLVVEKAVRYDHLTPQSCQPSSAGSCGVTVTITAPAAMAPPVFLYYRLDGFYQNYRVYAQSRSDEQLHGDSTQDIASCSPLERWNGKTLYPCGLIANSFFNDTFSVSAPGAKSGDFAANNPEVPWPSDKLKYSERPANTARNETSIGPGGFALPVPADPHMSQWLRVGAMSSFRKLYAVSQSPLKKGDSVTVNIASVFPATGFEKWLVLATTSQLGGAHEYLAWLQVVVGSMGIVAAIVLGWFARMTPPDVKRYFYTAEEAYDGVGDGLENGSSGAADD